MKSCFMILLFGEDSGRKEELKNEVSTIEGVTSCVEVMRYNTIRRSKVRSNYMVLFEGNPNTLILRLEELHICPYKKFQKVSMSGEVTNVLLIIDG